MAAIVQRRRVGLALSAVLATAAALLGLVPFVVVYLVAGHLFVAKQPVRATLLGEAAWAAVAVVAKVALKALANALSHATAYRIQTDLRQALADRLARMPLGRVRARSASHLKKVLQDEVEQLELGLSQLKDAPILLLDEAVASVDPETEVEIQRALAGLARGRTVIVVAHRPNTIRSADRIVVLAGNRVDGVGTHEELLRASPVYRRLWAAFERGSRYRDPPPHTTGARSQPGPAFGAWTR